MYPAKREGTSMMFPPSVDSRTRQWWPGYGGRCASASAMVGVVTKKSRPETVDASGEDDWQLKSLLAFF